MVGLVIMIEWFWIMNENCYHFTMNRKGERQFDLIIGNSEMPLWIWPSVCMVSKIFVLNQLSEYRTKHWTMSSALYIVNWFVFGIVLFDFACEYVITFGQILFVHQWLVSDQWKYHVLYVENWHRCMRAVRQRYVDVPWFQMNFFLEHRFGHMAFIRPYLK